MIVARLELFGVSKGHICSLISPTSQIDNTNGIEPD